MLVTRDDIPEHLDHRVRSALFNLEQAVWPGDGQGQIGLGTFDTLEEAIEAREVYIGG